MKESEPRLLVQSFVLGVIGALAAQIFLWALRLTQRLFLVGLAGYAPPGLPSEGGVPKAVVGAHGLWLIPLSTTLGGLLSGLLVYGLAPEAEGHGTDTVVRAFHRAGGFIRARVAPVKLIASAITIGSGGAAGREGPTALIGAGVGSLYATLMRRPEEERRILTLVGMAAGLSAIFRSPIGAAFFATEVLYGSVEFESGALLYTLLAALTAYATNGAFVGWRPLFSFSGSELANRLPTYGWLAVLGCAAGAVATALPEVFYRTRDAFRSLPFPRWVNPAIGGLVVGCIALAFPEVLGGGYGWIQQTMNGALVVHLLVILLVAKIVAFACTVSSGGSGGVFAPTLFVGAMLGGVCAAASHLAPDKMVVLGMAATFGAAARVPIAALVMVTEMTGEYELLPLAAFAVLVSYMVQSRLSSRNRYTSLYEAQVANRAASPARFDDNVRLALALLGTRRLSRSAQVGHLDLIALLDSGIPIQLPGRKVLHVQVLQAGSELVGRTVRWCDDMAAPGTLEVVAILRGGDVVLPSPDTVLQENDRLIIVGSDDARKRLTERMADTVRRTDEAG